MTEKPIAIDLCCGLFGWSEGLIAEGYQIMGFDIEDMHANFGLERPPEYQLVIQDICTLHGSQFKNATLIVASPPCQEYSYMAMPWKLAKAKAAAIRADTTGEKLSALNRLFNECFRIQREASFAAGRHIPMVVENVRGAQPWVGRAAWNYGSFNLWGDIPALMPITFKGTKVPGFRFDGNGGRSPAPGNNTRFTSRDCGFDHIKQPGIGGKRKNGKGDAWFQDGASRAGSKSSARKMASAMIAKIPLPLSRHIAATFRAVKAKS